MDYEVEGRFIPASAIDQPHHHPRQQFVNTAPFSIRKQAIHSRLRNIFSSGILDAATTGLPRSAQPAPFFLHDLPPVRQ
jgi:hypothetical protein